MLERHNVYHHELPEKTASNGDVYRQRIEKKALKELHKSNNQPDHGEENEVTRGSVTREQGHAISIKERKRKRTSEDKNEPLEAGLREEDTEKDCEDRPTARKVRKSMHGTSATARKPNRRNSGGVLDIYERLGAPPKNARLPQGLEITAVEILT